MQRQLMLSGVAPEQGAEMAAALLYHLTRRCTHACSFRYSTFPAAGRPVMEAQAHAPRNRTAARSHTNRDLPS